MQQYSDWYWAGCSPSTGLQPAQAPPRCTKCNSPPINGQCTNVVLFDVALQLPLESKWLKFIQTPRKIINYSVTNCEYTYTIN